MIFQLSYFMKYLLPSVEDDSMTTEASKKIFADEVVKDVQESWATISDDLQNVGYDIFQRLFTAYPAYQQLFRAFKDVPTDQLKSNKDYSKHALAVAKALNSSIENLENPEKLVSILTTVGKNHVKRNVTPEHYSNAQKEIVAAIGSRLGDASSDKVIASWNEVLAVAVSTISKGHHEEEAKFL